MSRTGAVFHIQRFSIHDGPGIRTTIFLKGCSLHCFWCHNPEGRRPSQEIQYFPDRCIACGACVAACPNAAHELHDGLHVFLRDRCLISGRCVETCYPQALQMSGRLMTVGQVMEEVLPDRAFYGSSGGGVTLSGGEPALAGEFAKRVLEACKREGFHTALETCGEYSWRSLDALLPVTDLILMDMKLMAPDAHRAATGRANDRILANARRLASTGKPMVIRTPIVPGVNDTDDDVRHIALFVRELADLQRAGGGGGEEPVRYELLAFHRMAAGKYASLGLDYGASAIDPPSRERMSALADVARGCGVETRIR